MQKTLAISGTDWHKQTVRWTLPDGALPKGQAARFVIAHAGGAAVDVDQISLFPDDNIDGLDPDVVRLAKEWNIPLLRFSGNYSSGYHWRDGVGPREARPTVRNVAWGGVDSHAFGTDEFLELCRRLGAVPQIGANAGTGTPEEAAAWVQYCNAKHERVPIWELGNELYGGWQIGHTDAPGYAARFVAFRDAVLKADPHIQIIANGKGEEFTGDGLAHDHTWNEDLLRAAVAKADRDTTAKIRRGIMADKDLSMYAHNVKIVTVNGAVTLKGPVKSEDEKTKVAEIAGNIVSSNKITNQITVK